MYVCTYVFVRGGMVGCACMQAHVCKLGLINVQWLIRMTLDKSFDQSAVMFNILSCGCL